MRPVFFDLRDGALLVEFPDFSDEEANRAAIALSAPLRKSPVDDVIPAARSVLVTYDPGRIDRETLVALVDRRVRESGRSAESAPARLLRVPVLYDGEDLPELASRSGLSAGEIARRHAAARYRVAFLGFAPGFAYLSGLPPELAAPRRTTPRPRVPAGSVAIGGSWSGIYPSSSPGGWRLLGRTSAVLFDPSADPPALLAPGDRVQLEAVDRLATPREPATPEPAGRPALRVLSPGLFTSIQGAPRPGLGGSGIPAGGAMDAVALAAANAAVGNPAGAPALESTLSGPELEVLTDLVVSGRGAVRAGDRLRYGRVERGAREYIAVAGGLAPRRAAEMTTRITAGEILRVDMPASAPSPALPESAAKNRLPEEIVLRAVLGPEASGFAPSEVERFFARTWRVAPESDRRGLRLESMGLDGEPLEHLDSPEIAPSGTVPGTIQVPGSGRPIVLGPDGPVTGGYPRLATVIGADLCLLGQARPGAFLRFEAVTFAEAASTRRAARSTITLP
jgi:KipI family sensor histidine kinase inhibitor